MAVTLQNQVEELSYETYVRRQSDEIDNAGLSARAKVVKASDKFKNHNGAWEMMPYPGYAVVSMVNNNPGNEGLIAKLIDIQSSLSSQLGMREKCYLLPSDSFHQTVANTLSSSRYKEFIKDAGIEKDYPFMIKTAFDQINGISADVDPIEMKLIGLSIFGSALGILGTFQKKSDFQRITDFRDSFYAIDELSQIDIRRTRPFIGHLTLAYFDGRFNDRDRQQLVKVCNQINNEIKEQELIFRISNTELRSYDDLSTFQTFPHYPKYSFIQN